MKTNSNTAPSAPTALTCLDCVLKHLGQAMILHEEEIPGGYPQYVYRVFGHLAEASRESIAEYPEIADLFRHHRLALMADRKHRIPYQGIMAYVDVVIACVNQGVPIPGIPDDLQLRPGSELVGPFEAP